MHSLLLLAFAFACGTLSSGRLGADVVDVAEDDVLIAAVREMSQYER